MRDVGRGRREEGRAPNPGRERHNSSQAKGDWMKKMENEEPEVEGFPLEEGERDPGKWSEGVSATRDTERRFAWFWAKKSWRGEARRGWSFLQLKVKVLRLGDSWSGGRPGRRSSPAPALGSSLGLSSLCTLSNESRRVRKVKVQLKDKPLIARKQKPLQPGGFSPASRNRERVMRARTYSLRPCQPPQECCPCRQVHLGGGGVAAGRIVFSPRLLLGKHPGASMSITCLTQITCSLEHQSREEKALCNSLERW